MRIWIRLENSKIQKINGTKGIVQVCHFIDEETGTGRLSILSKVKQQIHGNMTLALLFSIQSSDILLNILNSSIEFISFLHIPSAYFSPSLSAIHTTQIATFWVFFSQCFFTLSFIQPPPRIIFHIKSSLLQNL